MYRYGHQVRYDDIRSTCTLHVKIAQRGVLPGSREHRSVSTENQSRVEFLFDFQPRQGMERSSTIYFRKMSIIATFTLTVLNNFTILPVKSIQHRNCFDPFDVGNQISSKLLTAGEISKLPILSDRLLASVIKRKLSISFSRVSLACTNTNYPQAISFYTGFLKTSPTSRLCL